jgi:hypothetical protein
LAQNIAHPLRQPQHTLAKHKFTLNTQLMAKTLPAMACKLGHLATKYTPPKNAHEASRTSGMTCFVATLQS